MILRNMPSPKFIAIILIASRIEASPIKTGVRNDVESLKPTALDCSLPGELDYTGKVRYLEDCKSLNRFDIPIPVREYGTQPRVCCPKELGDSPICFPSDPWCPTFTNPDYDYDDDYYENYGTEELLMAELDLQCQNFNGTSCVPIHKCGKIEEFHATQGFCGFDSDQVKVCCSNENIVETPTSSMPARFPDPVGDGGEPRDCSDKNQYCKRWANRGTCDLDRSFETGDLTYDPVIGSIKMFTFMVLACQKSCNWCGIKGCVDEVPSCKDWARQGFCERSPIFMGHTCRESCGVCGYLSPENAEDQIFNGNSYTDIEKDNFDCGRFKALDELKANGVEVQQDEFPDREAPVDNKCAPVDLPPSSSTAATVTPNPQIAGADFFDIREVGREITVGNFTFVDDGNDDENDTSATLGLTSGSDEKINCGLILVSDRWMLTAAHCYDQFLSTNNIRVSNFRAYLPQHSEVVLQKKIYRHPGYRFPKLYNDIALVELGRRISFDYEALGDTPSCISKSSNNDGKIASITGWGETEEGQDAGDRLGTVNITLLNHQDCRQALNLYVKDKERKRGKMCRALGKGILNQHLCGTGEAACYQGRKIYSGACKGDSGGPVEVMVDGRRTVAGLVSGSLSCNSQLPEWFTNVAYFRPWIECILRESRENLESTNYKSQSEIEETCEAMAEPISGSTLDFCQDEV